MYGGWRADVPVKINRGIFNKLKSKQNLWEKLATKNVKTQFRLYPRPPIDTGDTRRTTFAKTSVNKSFFLFRFISLNEGGYAIKPLLGKGNNEKYKARNWLFDGATKTLFDIVKNVEK